MKKIRYNKPKLTEADLLAMPELLPGRRGASSWHLKVGEQGSAMYNTGLHGYMRIEKVEDPNYQKFLINHEFAHVKFSPMGPKTDFELTKFSFSSPVIVSGEAFYITEENRINKWVIENSDKLGINFYLLTEYWKNEINTDISLTLINRAKDIVIGDKFQRIDNFEEKLKDLIKAESGWYISQLAFSEVTSVPMSPIYDWIDNFSVDSLTPEQKLRALILKKTLHRFTAKQANFARDLYNDSVFKSLNYKKNEAFRYQELLKYLDTLFNKAKERSIEELESSMKLEKIDPDFKEALNVFDSETKNDILEHFQNELKEAREVIDQGNTTTIGNLRWKNLIWDTEVPLTKKLPYKKSYKGHKKSSDMGVVPTNIHRSLIDGNIFSRKIREQTGTILIDDSGSMHFTQKEIEEIIEHAPASLIAVYAASELGDDPNIKIVAKNGKYTEDLKFRAANNLVDMPALMWLAEQNEPRIWVSDAQAVPISGGTWEQAAGQCLAFCEKNKINVVATAQDAADVFSGKKALYR